MIMMTPRKALEIQASHVAHYAARCPDLAAKVAAMTKLDGVDLDVEMTVIQINKIIPRGGDIEIMCGLDPNRYD
jgi:hypothetical protein